MLSFFNRNNSSQLAAGWLFVFLCVGCILYSIPRQLAAGSFIENKKLLTKIDSEQHH
jgi:hypothetical protein